MVPSSAPNTIKCKECGGTVVRGMTYYRCPCTDATDDPYGICARCWDQERDQYTGAITLGQRVRMKIGTEWRLGSILKHWPDDDTYTIQLDGQPRHKAEAYDIYDAEWDVQLVDRNQLKPSPTRMLSRCDTSDSVFRSVPRCLTGCRMLTKEAETVYNHFSDERGTKLEFLSDEEERENGKEELDNDDKGGIFCDQCGDHVPSGKIYHCPNKSHGDGYDLCLRCSKKSSKPPPRLTSYDLKGVAEFIESGKCRKIAILCGAGISRSAGIPDFRSKDGIYKAVSKDLDVNAVKYGLTLRQKRAIQDDAQYVFSMELFKDNPNVLYHVLGDILNKRCRPTMTHCFMKLLQNRGLLRHVFTQNVDGLERYIGINPKFLCEVHGTFMTASCYQCGAAMPIGDVRDSVMRGDIPIQCPDSECSGYIKPDCVLFGEDLPHKYYDAVDLFTKHKDRVDLLIVMGTSLSVKPVADFPRVINGNAIRVVMNLELNREVEDMFDFDAESDKRDLFIAGKCDETIQELCGMLGWKADLESLFEESNELALKIAKELVQSDSSSGQGSA